ncbi:MAG: hypothetical protein LBI40_03270 [Treponema sp.]|jgi:hypothetical protein|nr:hypothetical protein [Treponema sp.]
MRKRRYPLRYTDSGLVYIDEEYDLDMLIDVLIETNYLEGFCVFSNLDPIFILALMKAGFLVMSMRLIHYLDATYDMRCVMYTSKNAHEVFARKLFLSVYTGTTF